MRMSDSVDTETMKVSETADTVSSPKDNATKSEVSDQSQSSRDEHGSNNKRDGQVKNCDISLNSKRLMVKHFIQGWGQLRRKKMYMKTNLAF